MKKRKRNFTLPVTFPRLTPRERKTIENFNTKDVSDAFPYLSSLCVKKNGVYRQIS